MPSLEPFERVSTRVIRVLGFNPGPYTLQGTNTYLIGTGNERILIDTGEHSTSSDYISFLLQTVLPSLHNNLPLPLSPSSSSSSPISISHIILTHGHPDHMGGVIPLLSALSHTQSSLPTVYKRQVPQGHWRSTGFHCEHITDNQIFSVEGATVRSVYTPGHTDDHVCFIVEEDKAVISGDCVLGCGSCVFEDLSLYLSSLSRLLSLMRQQNLNDIYPGHGPIIYNNATERVEQYINHRNEREREILSILSNKERERERENQMRMTDKLIERKRIEYWKTSWNLVRVIYGESIPTVLKFSAQHVIQLHLNKLKKENKIEYNWPDLWRMKSTEIEKEKEKEE